MRPFSPDESRRLNALRNYNILDTDAEKVFDDLTLLASHICGTPIALISLVDENRQWFKSRIGLDVAETSRDVAFCAHAILQKSVFTVPDATLDRRFSDNPLVTSNPNIRFYAGMPLITTEGHGLGTLCVIDRVPKTLAAEQERALEALGRQVMSQLELRRAIETRKVMDEKLREEEKRAIEQQRVVEIQQTQIQTMREVTLTLMDRINNPLAIIMMTFELWQRDHRLPGNVIGKMDTVRQAATRISAVLQEVSQMEKYKTMNTSFGRVLDVYTNETEHREA